MITKRNLFFRTKSQIAFQILKRRKSSAFSKVNKFNFFPISTYPKIALVYTPSGLDHIVELAKAYSSSETCHFLIFFNWYMNPVQILNFRNQVRQIGALNSKFIVHPLCNSELEFQNFRRLTPELGANFINQNIVLDESIYEVQTSWSERSGAIINSRMLPFKRLELAAKVSNLSVITCGWRKDGNEYQARVQESLSHANWLNISDDGKYGKLSESEITSALNQKKVGLIFSKREGACFAATEFLLCGLPVISTPSVGGRDAFFNQSNSRIVAADESEIAAKVDELYSSDTEPTTIRNSALKIILEHRQRFCRLVDTISDGYGVRRSFSKEWSAVHSNKMMNFTTTDKFFEFINS